MVVVGEYRRSRCQITQCTSSVDRGPAPSGKHGVDDGLCPDYLTVKLSNPYLLYLLLRGA
jgi:hypothetical protein